MKLARVRTRSGQEVAGQLVGEALRPLPAGMGILEVLALPKAERDALEANLDSSADIPLADAELLVPVRPIALKDFMGYEKHFLGAIKWGARQAGGMPFGETDKLPDFFYERPMFWVADSAAVIGPSDALTMPPNSVMMDCEVELAVVMGKGGRDLTLEQAADAIGGYTVFLDWSARDVLLTDKLGPTKGKDAGNTIGPCITTKDEMERFRVGDRIKVPMSLKRNDELIGEGDTEQSVYSIEEMVAWVSRGAAIHPGDVIAFGTPANMCWIEQWGHNGEDRPSPIKPGDVISINVGGIGEMAVHVKPAAPHVELPRARSYLGA